MMAHRLSMSRMALAHACLYGFRADVDVTPRPSGRPARIGSALHTIVEMRIKGRTLDLGEPDDTIVAEAYAIADGPLKGWVESRPWGGCEIGLRYDAEADECCEGPRRGEPDYEDVPAMVLPGTLDLIHVAADRIIVRDLKSGKPPADREQLYAQAVAASRRWNRSVVEIGYVRALKTKVEELDVETLDAERLDEEAGRIARVLRRLPMSEPQPGEDHCWKCDARGACPAFGATKAEAKMADLEAAGFFG